MNWKNGVITTAKVNSLKGEPCTILVPAGKTVYDAKGKALFVASGTAGQGYFQTVKGGAYTIR